ncbi:MAG TPA: SRPBCC domain-containing protein, partial [Actinomycetota bacterium]
MVREISITRIFAAPRDLVWRAWTEAEQLAQWFMPHGFTVPECDM